MPRAMSVEARRKPVPQDSHRHYCSKCDVWWQHKNYVLFRDFDKAHKCPSCGGEVTRKSKYSGCSGEKI